MHTHSYKPVFRAIGGGVRTYAFGVPVTTNITPTGDEMCVKCGHRQKDRSTARGATKAAAVIVAGLVPLAVSAPAIAVGLGIFVALFGVLALAIILGAG